MGDGLTEAGAFVFQGGLASAESATVVRQSGGDFLITDKPDEEDHVRRGSRPHAGRAG